LPDLRVQLLDLPFPGVLGIHPDPGSNARAAFSSNCFFQA
jgi:hypothetical protein